MKKNRRIARWQLIVLVSVLAVFIAGCSNIRNGVSWPALALVTINDEPRVLVIHNDRVEAIDPVNGQVEILRDEEGTVMRDDSGNVLEWSLKVDNGQTFYVAPLLKDEDGNGTFYFPTYDNRLLVVDRDTATIEDEEGIPLTDGVIADVVVSDDLIYVPYRSGDVVALNRETYAEEWRFETSEGVWAAPLLVDDVLYVTSINHFLYALNAETGTEVWAEPVDLEGAIASTPLFYNDYLYIGSYSHKMYKISLEGEIVNVYEDGHNWIWGSPVIKDDFLYYTDLNGYVYALNADDLTAIWVERPSGRGIRPGPLVTDEYVVVAARDGAVYRLNRETGLPDPAVADIQVEGRPEFLSDILYIPASDDDTPALMLVASPDNKRLVVAINMETFSTVWVYQR